MPDAILNPPNPYLRTTTVLIDTWPLSVSITFRSFPQISFLIVASFPSRTNGIRSNIKHLSVGQNTVCSSRSQKRSIFLRVTLAVRKVCTTFTQKKCWIGGSVLPHGCTSLLRTHTHTHSTSSMSCSCACFFSSCYFAPVFLPEQQWFLMLLLLTACCSLQPRQNSAYM